MAITLDEVKQGGDFLYEIPKEQETVFRVLSPAFEVLVQHYDKIQRRYYACVGKDKGCPGCEDDTQTPKKRFLAYIDDGQVKMAGLPYSVLQFLKAEKDKDPNSFKDDVSQFAIKVFRSGTGLETTYHVEKDVDDTEEKDLSSYEPIDKYIEAEKEKTLKMLSDKKPLTEDNKEEKTTSNTAPF